MNFCYKKRHNIAAYLETTHEKSEPYRHAINYLLGSRVSYALSASITIYEDHQREFWDSIVVSEDKQTLSGTVANRSVIVNEAIIREVLRLDDACTSTSFSSDFVRETVLLMGYPEDQYTNEVFKKYLCPQWRFIVHTYLHCMTHLQAAWDRLQAASTLHPFIAIVRRQPFNFSNWILERLVENLSPTKNKRCSLLFPRFLQLIFNHQRPDLPRSGKVLLRGDMQYRVFVSMEADPRVPDVPLLPHMTGENLPVEPDAINLDQDDILPCPRGHRYTLRRRCRQRYNLRPRQAPTENEGHEMDDAENAKEVVNDKDDDNDNDGDRADIRRQHIVPTRTRPHNRRVVLRPQARDGDEAFVTQEDEASGERSSKLLRLAEVTSQHVLITSEPPPPLTSAPQTPITTTTATTIRPAAAAAPFQVSPSSSLQDSPSMQCVYDRLKAQDAIIQAQSSIIDELNRTVRTHDEKMAVQDARVESLQAQLNTQQGTIDPFIIDTMKEQHSTKISQLQVQIDILFKALTARQAIDAQQVNNKGHEGANC